MCYIFVSLDDNCAIADSIYKKKLFFAVKFVMMWKKDSNLATKRELVEIVSSIDGSEKYWWWSHVWEINKKKIAEVSVSVCLKAKQRGGERNQQKIARFECIQLFCLWALFKYDIIIYIHPVVLLDNIKCYKTLIFTWQRVSLLMKTIPSCVVWQRRVLRNKWLLLRADFNNVLKLKMK